MWIPEIDDRVYHAPTKTVVTVQSRYRNPDMSIDLFDLPKCQGTRYNLEDCLKYPPAFQVGEKVFLSQQGMSDDIVEILDVATLADKSDYNYTVKSVEEQDDRIFTALESRLLIQYEGDRPLNDSELSTLMDMAAAIVESGNPEELKILTNMTNERRIQLWAELTPELREGLKELKQRPSQPPASTEGLRTIVAGSRTIT